MSIKLLDFLYIVMKMNFIIKKGKAIDVQLQKFLKMI